MVDGIIYRCTECNERFFFTEEYSSIEKSPCPMCETCTIEKHKDKRKTIQSDMTAGDIYDEVDKFNGL